MDKFAHSIEGKPQEEWEPLPHHLQAVAETAARFAGYFGGTAVAAAMGLLHDIGKFSLPYQNYISNPSGQGGPKGPDHSTAGAKEAVRIYGTTLGRLMAFGIAGHHAGLTDGAGNGAGNLSERLHKTVEDYHDWRAHAVDLPAAADLVKACPEPGANAIDASFSVAFLARILFSCLVDADFLETEAFYARSRGESPPDRGGVLKPVHRDKVRAHMARHRRADSPVNRLRSDILDYANAKATLAPGLFTLTVPTGGGKTLTSLSFAMEHAFAHDLRRIIYVIPFTSIIEQCAQIFRDEVGLGDAVLEHHSNFDYAAKVPSNEDDREQEGAFGLFKMRRDSENWDAPVVVTTAVQFFESLFAARTSKARKLHNLAKSIIILDEAQSIPVKLLRPCMAAIDELARNYGATVILCTATQPALRTQDEALPLAADGKVEGLTIPPERELAPDPQSLYRQLRRVTVEWRRDPVSDVEIAACFAKQPQMLCVVNSRAHALALFEAIRDQPGAMHLSTLMCARHRRTILAKARADLDAGRQVRLVATSLIEAGVDISFPEVWRAAAGLANIAQVAGRCNRNGELGPLGEAFGRAVVFEPDAVDGGRPVPTMIEPFYQAAKEVLKSGIDDVLGLQAVREYYRWLYWAQRYEALDMATLPGGIPYPIIPAIRNTARGLNFPFARIAEAFRMIDDAMEPVIVPWDEEARDAILILRRTEFPPVGVRRKLQQYVAPVPAKARAAMLASGAVQPIRPEIYGDRFIVLESLSLYDEALGLRQDDPTWRSSESNVF